MIREEEGRLARAMVWGTGEAYKIQVSSCEDRQCNAQSVTWTESQARLAGETAIADQQANRRRQDGGGGAWVGPGEKGLADLET